MPETDRTESSAATPFDAEWLEYDDDTRPAFEPAPPVPPGVKPPEPPSVASPSRDEYPKDCPNCGLWLTAESMDCPRCMTKFPHESSAEQKREQAEEAVEEWRGAGGKLPDQPMRADSAATTESRRAA